jgi:oligoendopeptidase F
MLRTIVAVIGVCMMMTACGVQDAGQSGGAGNGDDVKSLPERSSIDDQFKWKLDHIYDTNDAWEMDFAAVKADIPNLAAFSGKLGDSPKTLLDFFTLRDKVSNTVEKMMVYAKMRRDEDTRESTYQGLSDRIDGLITEFRSALAFVDPELLAIPEDKLRGFLNVNEVLQVYNHSVDDLLRTRKHVLSQREEELLAMSGEVYNGASNIFGMLNNADMKFPVIQDEDGNDVELTKGNFGVFLESTNRDVRRNAFESLYGSYRKVENTLAASFSTQIKRDVLLAKARNFGTARESALHANNIPTQVYDNLVSAIHENFAPLRRYVNLRKKILGLDAVHQYDVYTPLFTAEDAEYTYDEGQELVTQYMAPLGKDYLKAMTDGMKYGWIDVYENQGKQSGAYSWGSYATHPYVLLNYTDKLDDVFTLAHELGHAMHSYYSREAQPYIYGDYTIFLAEVASTANEALLMQGLINDTKDVRQKQVLLNRWLDNIVGTFYRQTMFAEFEMIVHSAVEEGQPLTTDWLSERYGQLYETYYGDSYGIDEDLKLEWARIPHFYYNFYVFQYATGYAASQALANAIIEEGQPAVDRYLKFISLGGSQYSIEQLKTAGVDMTSKQPIEAIARLMNRLLDDLEATL